MANSRHIRYTITSMSPEPDHIKALVSGYAWKNFRDGTTQVKYSTTLPAEALTNPSWHLPAYVVKPLLSAEDLTDLIKKSFGLWASSSNIQFIEDSNDYVIPFYKFTGNFTTPIKVSGYGNITGAAGYAHYPDTGRGIGLGDSSYLWLKKWLMPELIMDTINHEIGHGGIGLKHPFEPPYALTKPYEKLTSYSIMNYDDEMIGWHTIVPLTPMPADIDAAQYLYGVNTQANLGNTIHHVDKYYREGIRTISAIDWDYSGNDTLSASGANYDVTLNLRPYSRSKVGEDTYLAMPNMDIENIIAGNHKNTLILNSLDNTVDIRTSAQSIVMTDPSLSGHDVVIGFNSNRDSLILESSDSLDSFSQEKPFSTSSQAHAIINGQNTIVTGSTCNTTITINNQTTEVTGTKIQFSENNSLFIADIKPEDVVLKFQINKELDLIRKRLPHQQGIPGEKSVSFWAENYDISKDLFFEFQKGFLNAAVSTFLISLTEDVLKEAKLTPKQISILKSVMQFSFLWYSEPYQTIRIALLLSCITLANEFYSKKNHIPSISSYLITIINSYNRISVTENFKTSFVKSLTSLGGYVLGEALSIDIKNELIPPKPPSLEENLEKSLEYWRQKKSAITPNSSSNLSRDDIENMIKHYEARLNDIRQIRVTTNDNSKSISTTPTDRSGYGRFFKPVLRLGACALGAATLGPLGLIIGAAGTTIVPSLVNRLHDSCKNYGKATPSPNKSG
jgi:hypothetical protein